MEVKKAGKYKTKSGRIVEIYGFDSLGGNKVLAEGFFKDTRNMCWFNPETGMQEVATKDLDQIIEEAKD